MSKQLESIMGRVVAATPAMRKSEPAPDASVPALSIVPAAPEPAQPPAIAVEPAPATQIAPAPAAKAKRGQGAPTAVPKPPKAEEPVTAEADVPLQAYVPASIRKAVLIHAATHDTTTRALILKGLQAIGFEISDEQIRDRRRA